MNRTEYQQFFDLARTHWWFLGTRAIIADTVERATPQQRTPRILDVGCGAGNVLETLGDRYRRFGLDYEFSALEVCRAHVDAALVQADAQALPYADASFDIVLATDMFEHVKDDRRAAAECARVCRPGGAVVAAVPAYPMLYGPHDMALDHFRRYTRRNFLDLIRSAGLTLQRASYFNALLLPPIAAVRLAQRAFIRDPAAYTIDYSAGGGGGPLGKLLLGLLLFERAWLRKAPLPAGVSLLAVATRGSA